jgi:outer membrane receptor protein involved in Fe transport
MIGFQEDRMELDDSEFISNSKWIVGDNDITIFNNKLLDTGRERTSSLFVQIKHNFNKQFIGNFGIRYDRKKRHLGGLSKYVFSRAALIWNPHEKFDVKISYSRPFIDALYWYRHSNLQFFKGNPSLEAEHMESYQVTPTFKFLDGKLSSSFNFFYNKFSDFIHMENELSRDRQYQKNAGFLKVWGIETEISYRGKASNLAFNLTYQRADDVKNYSAVFGDRIHNIPNWTANFIFNVNPFDWFEFQPESVSRDLWLNLTARYIGEQLSPIDEIMFPNGTVFEEEPNNEVDEVWLFNTGFRWDKFWNGFFLDGRLYNLFDKQYYQGGSVSHPYPQPGRWWMLTLGYQGDFL